jgi:uncharacterized protein
MDNTSQRTPCTLEPLWSGAIKDDPAASAPEWVPSRFNVRTTTSDGSLVLWNTYSNRMSAFSPRLAPYVRGLLNRRGTVAKREGLIEFLAERAFLVDEKSDEFRQFRSAFDKDHYAKDRLLLFLLASEDCNFRCRYCYERFARGTMEPWVRTRVKRYLAKQVPLLAKFQLAWFGGEPLCGMEAIGDIAPAALELASRHSVDYSSKMTTNGYLLTPGVVDRLFEWRIMEYQVTLDGPPEHHDRYRPTRDGGATFAAILENLKAMQARSEEFRVMVRINFDRDNSSTLAQLLDILEHELHRDSRFRIVFRSIDRLGGRADAELNICSPEESAAIQQHMQSQARKHGLLLTGTVHRAGGLGARVCYAARPNSFIIGAAGKIMKCTVELDHNDRNIVGTIDESGDLALDDKKMSLWTAPAFENFPKCKKCVFVPSCQGMSCPLLRLQANDPPCVIERTAFQRLLRDAVVDLPVKPDALPKRRLEEDSGIERRDENGDSGNNCEAGIRFPVGAMKFHETE